MTAGFVHLHTHSEFSPIDSLAKVRDLVDAAADDQNPALAVTDHGTLGGLWKLNQYAQTRGITPIPGVEAYLAIGSRHEHNEILVEDDADPDPDGTTAAKAKRYEHLTLLAVNPTGWTNLVTLMNEAHESYWYKPRIDYDLLAEHSAGLVILTGCLGGPVLGPLVRGDRDQAEANLRRLVSIAGADNVFVEVMHHDIAAETAVVDDVRELARQVGVQLVATNDSHYIHADAHDAHDAWLAVGTHALVGDVERFRFHGDGYHLRTEAEMRALFDGAPWWQEACDTTVKIAARVTEPVLPAPRLRLPKYPVPAPHPDASTYLRHLVREGAFERYGADPARPDGRYLPPEVNERLKFEFSVVEHAGLADYFLIVWDIVTWARSDRGLPTAEHPKGLPGEKLPIRVGPGRGSAAGACLSYCVGIVGIDPLANGLLFERFLNPQRAGMPDVDVDFEKARRPEVLRYIEARFGRDRVARIGTFGIAATRAAIKDAARVLNLTPLGEKLSPLVPIGAGGKPVPFTTLDDTSEKAGDAFRAALGAAHGDGPAVMELARAFEGVTKQEGIHACGTLIADEPMQALVPLRHDLAKGASPDDLLVTVWDGRDVDSYGLLKMDVLGIRNLDVISKAVEFIAEDTGEVIDPDRLVPGDPADLERDGRTWDLISAGRTAGVFQLESAGMTRLAEQVAPSSLDDLTALVALYRPGPLAAGMDQHYAARKNGREPVSYDYLTPNSAEQQAIASVLGGTYGVVCYQEQLMSLGAVVGGLDAGMRNKLQKAFSKKKAEMMAEVKEAMFAGALAGAGTSGVAFARDTLDKLWVTFEGSAAYLFNKSHACAYGFLAYVTAYLKANWPVQYGAALLAATDDADKRGAAIGALLGDGIEVLAPDLNRSGRSTRPEGGAVRLGLSEVKDVGKNAAAIIEERERGGPFTGLSDLLVRVKPAGKALSIKAVEALIDAGALDTMGTRMGLAQVARAVKFAPDLQPPTCEWGVLERATRQRARLGLITGQHPLVELAGQLQQVTVAGRRPNGISAVAKATDGQQVFVLGVLSRWVEKPYKHGRMASLTVEGSRASADGVMWEQDRAQLTDGAPTPGRVVVIAGRVRVRLVETEHVDEAGETVYDSFERRDLTVRAVKVVPVDDHLLNAPPLPALAEVGGALVAGGAVEIPAAPDLEPGGAEPVDDAAEVALTMPFGAGRCAAMPPGLIEEPLPAGFFRHPGVWSVATEEGEVLVKVEAGGGGPGVERAAASRGEQQVLVS